MGLRYTCLIYRLVTELRVSFLEWVPIRVSWPIGHNTISQSMSHASSEPTEPVDLTMPADPIDDFICLSLGYPGFHFCSTTY